VKDLRKWVEEMRDAYIVSPMVDEADAAECTDATDAIDAALQDKIIQSSELAKDRNILSLVDGVPTDVPTLADLTDFVVRLGHPVQTK